jgi:hypothetical protein
MKSYLFSGSTHSSSKSSTKKWTFSGTKFGCIGERSMPVNVVFGYLSPTACHQHHGKLPCRYILPDAVHPVALWPQWQRPHGWHEEHRCSGCQATQRGSPLQERVQEIGTAVLTSTSLITNRPIGVILQYQCRSQGRFRGGKQVHITHAQWAIFPSQYLLGYPLRSASLRWCNVRAIGQASMSRWVHRPPRQGLRRR